MWCAGAGVACVQGNIAAWRKAEGDSVQPGDILAEIETDKATIEWEAQEEGFIAKILKPAGQHISHCRRLSGRPDSNRGTLCGLSCGTKQQHSCSSEASI
jgi:hypothetical protein